MKLIHELYFNAEIKKKNKAIEDNQMNLDLHELMEMNKKIA
jgi:hypothetical protein